MDKKSSQPIRSGHVASGDKKESFFSSFFCLVRAVGEKGENIFKHGEFLERECVTSL